jgi:hypothetical protein
MNELGASAARKTARRRRAAQVPRIGEPVRAMRRLSSREQRRRIGQRYSE